VLTDDAVLTMPPYPLQYHGRLAICGFFTAMDSLVAARLVATRANGQPAFGYYARDGLDRPCQGHAVLVLTLRDDRVSQITAFPAAASVLPYFGLPAASPATDESWGGAVSEQA
jgi:hypothetical protein